MKVKVKRLEGRIQKEGIRRPKHPGKEVKEIKKKEREKEGIGDLPSPVIKKSLNMNLREMFQNMKTLTKTRASGPIQASSTSSKARKPSKPEGREGRGKEENREKAEAFLRRWICPKQSPEWDRLEPGCRVERVSGREDEPLERSRELGQLLEG